MIPYARRQILVLLLLLVVAGIGLAVGHWRRARPDLADFLEQLDRTPSPSSPLPPPAYERGSTPAPTPERGSSAVPAYERGSSAAPASEPEPRRARRGKAPPAVSPAVDLNRADATELTRLPGIGPALAQRIVDVRRLEGPFARVDELGRVRGMSIRRIEQLRELVTIAR